MYFSEQEVARFGADGYIILPPSFSETELVSLGAEAERVFAVDSPGKVLENDNVTVRSVHGPHFISSIFQRIARHPILLRNAKALLGGDVYIHQYKVNAKRALVGDIWEWHSDYWFWKNEDGMPTPNALTAAIFLDAVTEFNGPMYLIPGSHRIAYDSTHHTRPYGEIDGGENWKITTAATLKYRLSRELLQTLILQNGLVSAIGKSGSVLFFHSNVLHGSSSNVLPWDRKLILISYNLVSNAPSSVKSPRPEFMAYRSFTPLTEDYDRSGRSSDLNDARTGLIPTTAD